MRTQKLKIDSAESIDNGICFYSKRHNGYVAFASIDDQGNIKSTWMPENLYEKLLEYDDKIVWTLKEKIYLLIFSVLAILVVVKFVYPFICTHLILSLRIVLLVIPFILVSSFLLNYIHYGNDEDEKSSKRFHSAEHMVINAFHKLQRIPSLEEVRQFSRFHSSCGTNQVVLISIYFVLFFICTFLLDSDYLGLVIIIALIFIHILLLCGFLNFLQKFTTLPPTDKELKVAIAGLTTWYENEKKEEKSSFLYKLLHRLFPRFFY